MSKITYSYWDTEDGEDCEKKLEYMAKRAFAVGTFAFYPFNIALQRPDSYLKFGLTYCRSVVPVIGVATVFTATTCMLCKHVPQVDQKLNYFIGGSLGGSVIGAYYRNAYRGAWYGCALGLAAAIAKGVDEVGGEWFPQNLREKSVYSFSDMSLLEEPPRAPPLAAPGF